MVAVRFQPTVDVSRHYRFASRRDARLSIKRRYATHLFLCAKYGGLKPTATLNGRSATHIHHEPRSSPGLLDPRTTSARRRNLLPFTTYTKPDYRPTGTTRNWPRSWTGWRRAAAGG